MMEIVGVSRVSADVIHVVIDGGRIGQVVSDQCVPYVQPVRCAGSSIKYLRWPVTISPAFPSAAGPSPIFALTAPALPRERPAARLASQGQVKAARLVSLSTSPAMASSSNWALDVPNSP